MGTAGHLFFPVPEMPGAHLIVESRSDGHLDALGVGAVCSSREHARHFELCSLSGGHLAFAPSHRPSFWQDPRGLADTWGWDPCEEGPFAGIGKDRVDRWLRACAASGSLDPEFEALLRRTTLRGRLDPASGLSFARESARLVESEAGLWEAVKGCVGSSFLAATPWLVGESAAEFLSRAQAEHDLAYMWRGGRWMALAWLGAPADHGHSIRRARVWLPVSMLLAAVMEDMESLAAMDDGLPIGDFAAYLRHGPTDEDASDLLAFWRVAKPGGFFGGDPAARSAMERLALERSVGGLGGLLAASGPPRL